MQPIRSRSESFTVLACPNNRENGRLGIVVAKRYVKRAVDRNRVRRLIRECFRLEQDSLCGLDFVVLARCNIFKQVHCKSPQRVLFKHWQEVVNKWKKD